METINDQNAIIIIRLIVEMALIVLWIYLSYRVYKAVGNKRLNIEVNLETKDEYNNE